MERTLEIDGRRVVFTIECSGQGMATRLPKPEDPLGQGFLGASEYLNGEKVWEGTVTGDITSDALSQLSEDELIRRYWAARRAR